MQRWSVPSYPSPSNKRSRKMSRCSSRLLQRGGSVGGPLSYDGWDTSLQGCISALLLVKRKSFLSQSLSFLKVILISLDCWKYETDQDIVGITECPLSFYSGLAHDKVPLFTLWVVSSPPAAMAPADSKRESLLLFQTQHGLQGTMWRKQQGRNISVAWREVFHRNR
jgi:hypothetical protein